MWIFPNNSIFIKSSFTLKLDFLKIKFKNRSILLDSFIIEIFCYIFWKKRQMSILAQMLSSAFYLVSFLGSRCVDSVWVNMGISFQLTPPNFLRWEIFNPTQNVLCFSLPHFHKGSNCEFSFTCMDTYEHAEWIYTHAHLSPTLLADFDLCLWTLCSCGIGW